MAVGKGSLLATQLERVKEFWEAKWNRISKKILCIVRRKERGRKGWGKRWLDDFFWGCLQICSDLVFETPVKSVAWKKKDTNFVLVWVVTPLRVDHNTVSSSPPTCIICGQRFCSSSWNPPLLFYPLWIATANIWFLPGLGVEWAWQRLSAGSPRQHRNQTGTFLSPLERSEWWSWLIPCSHQAPGAGDTLEPMYLILKWERAARSSLHAAFPSWSGVTVGSKESMFSY